MAIVYRAWDPRLERHVALKLLRERGDLDMDESRARLLREGRLASNLDHASIVRVHEAGEVESVAYIVMEWVEGVTLRSLMSRSRRRGAALDRSWCIEALSDVAEALAHAHAAGVIHRDLKPSNLMLDRRGLVRLLDFGLAKSNRPEAMALTGEHVVIGTPRYMAPEQTVDAQGLDARVDQYAWGVLAFELLAGVHPSDLSAGGADVPLSAAAPSIPAGLCGVVDRARSFVRDDRFPSMDALLAEWRRAFSQAFEAEVAPTLDVVERAPVGLTPRHPRRRRAWDAFAIAVVIVSVAALLAVYLVFTRP